MGDPNKTRWEMVVTSFDAEDEDSLVGRLIFAIDAADVGVAHYRVDNIGVTTMALTAVWFLDLGTPEAALRAKEAAVKRVIAAELSSRHEVLR